MTPSINAQCRSMLMSCWSRSDQCHDFFIHNINAMMLIGIWSALGWSREYCVWAISVMSYPKVSKHRASNWCHYLKILKCRVKSTWTSVIPVNFMYQWTLLTSKCMTFSYISHIILSRATSHRSPSYDGVKTWVKGSQVQAKNTVTKC